MTTVSKDLEDRHAKGKEQQPYEVEELAAKHDISLNVAYEILREVGPDREAADEMAERHKGNEG